MTSLFHLSFFILLTTTALPILLKPRQSDPVSQLLLIAPTSDTCTSAPFVGECSTSTQAVGPLVSSFGQYSITTAPEQVALLSWIAYESAEFKYNQNHFPPPGTPGQGTRTMMMPEFVAEYVASIPELTDKIPSDGDVVEMLELVENDQYGWASAAWFYSTQCNDDVKNGVRNDGQQGWESFLTGCVGVNPEEGDGQTSRLAYWQRACEALGVE